MTLLTPIANFPELESFWQPVTRWFLKSHTSCSLSFKKNAKKGTTGQASKIYQVNLAITTSRRASKGSRSTLVSRQKRPKRRSRTQHYLRGGLSRKRGRWGGYNFVWFISFSGCFIYCYFWQLSAHVQVPGHVLVAGSIGPYGACLGDGSEYTGAYLQVGFTIIHSWFQIFASQNIKISWCFDILSCQRGWQGKTWRNGTDLEWWRS